MQRGWRGLQVGQVAASSPAAPSYHCSLEMSPLNWHLSFPPLQKTPAAEGWEAAGGVRAGREAPHSWFHRGGSTATPQWEDATAMAGAPSTTVLGSDSSKRVLFINFPARIKKERARSELCACFYMLFICFYSCYCCSLSASFTAFQMGENITNPSLAPRVWGKSQLAPLVLSPLQHHPPQPFSPFPVLCPCWFWLGDSLTGAWDVLLLSTRGRAACLSCLPLPVPANQSTGSRFPAGSPPSVFLSPGNARAGEKAVGGAVVASPGCCSHLSLLPAGGEDGRCLLSCFAGAAIPGLKPSWSLAVGEDQACNGGRENCG